MSIQGIIRAIIWGSGNQALLVVPCSMSGHQNTSMEAFMDPESADNTMANRQLIFPDHGINYAAEQAVMCIIHAAEQAVMCIGCTVPRQQMSTQPLSMY